VGSGDFRISIGDGPLNGTRLVLCTFDAAGVAAGQRPLPDVYLPNLAQDFRIECPANCSTATSEIAQTSKGKQSAVAFVDSSLKLLVHFFQPQKGPVRSDGVVFATWPVRSSRDLRDLQNDGAIHLRSVVSRDSLGRARPEYPAGLGGRT
jgi:hypothetical protein